MTSRAELVHSRITAGSGHFRVIMGTVEDQTKHPEPVSGGRRFKSCQPDSGKPLLTSVGGVCTLFDNSELGTIWGPGGFTLPCPCL